MSMTLGALYLIPSCLAPETPGMIPSDTREAAQRIRHYFVENERSARRFLRSLDRSFDIDACRFSLVNVTESPDLALLGKWLGEGLEVGVISEAGFPCIADPGERIVAEAHRLGARVVPLAGPNAMLMALAASGLNGERFCFSGYLPIQATERAAALKALEKRVLQQNETQLFMETPYRNNALAADILKQVNPALFLCLAADLTAPSQYIRTRRIADWKGQLPDLHKRPVVFLLGQPG